MGIPNLNPFKSAILKRLEEQQRIVKLNDVARQQRQQDFARKRKLEGEDPLAGLAADAAARERAYTLAAEVADTGAIAGGIAAPAAGRAGELTRRAFYRHVKSLLERADIILEVLDARDPLSCRAPAIEALALAADPPKRVVLVLNKIDLVPPAAVQAWLAYLRRDFPTVAFKASTQTQRTHLSAPGGAAVNAATEAGAVLTGAGAAGADTLLQLIKNYSRSHDLKTAVTVGVVGYPNVGKSSLINSLKRGRAVGVSPTPGHTRALQEVSLDAKVSLIDCPGVIFDDEAGAVGEAPGADAGAGLLLRNCVRVEDIADPEGAAAAIVRRCAPAKLMALYAIASFATAADFLALVAVKRGKLGKGGVPDKAGAARAVLSDWNSGKIPFYVLPPAPAASAGAGASVDAMDESGVEVPKPRHGALAVSAGEDDGTGVAAIVAGWSKEFDMDAIVKAESAMLAAARGEGAGSDFFSVAAAAPALAKPQSAAARAAAARLLAKAATGVADGMDEDDDEDGSDDYDDANDDDDDGDDDGDDDDDDDDGSNGEAAAAAPAGDRRVRFAAAKPPAKSAAAKPASVKPVGKAAAKPPAPAMSSEPYDWSANFKGE